MKTKIAASLIFFFAFTLTNAQGIEFVHDMTFEQILEKAKAENKIIFMDCFTTWCGPCKRLSANTFPDPNVGAFFNARYINVKMDMEKGEGPELSGRFGVRAYPTLLWIDGNGNVKHKAMGYMDPSGLLEQARTASDDSAEKLGELQQKYDAGNRELPFLSEYIDALNKNGSMSDEKLKEFINKLSAKELQSEIYMKTIFDATTHLRSPGVKVILDNKAFLAVKFGTDNVIRKFNGLADKGISDAVIKKDETLFNDAISFLKNSGNQDADRRIANAHMDYYLRIRNFKEYDKYATAFIKKFAGKDEKQLNDVAWNYYINVDDVKALEKAKKWAFAAVNLKNTVDNNTTYAYLNYKLGQYKEADLACDYALLKAKEEGSAAASASALKDLLKKENLKK